MGAVVYNEPRECRHGRHEWGRWERVDGGLGFPGGALRRCPRCGRWEYEPDHGRAGGRTRPLAATARPSRAAV